MACEFANRTTIGDQATPRSVRRRFISRATALVYEGDMGGARDLFAPLPAPLRYDLAGEVLDKLARHGAVRGDWSRWAVALHYLPHPGREAAGCELRARFDAIARGPAALSDASRRRLASYAARCVQAGIRGDGLVRRLAVENAKLTPPLPTGRLTGLAQWAEGISHAA